MCDHRGWLALKRSPTCWEWHPRRKEAWSLGAFMCVWWYHRSFPDLDVCVRACVCACGIRRCACVRTFVGVSGGFYPISMWCWNGVAIYRLFVPLDCVRAEQVM